MTPQQIVGLAARLFAIWLGLTAFQAIGIAQAMRSGSAQAPTWVPYFIACLYFVGALFLWFFPMFIAHKLVPRTQFEDRLRLPSEQVVVVSCVILGLMAIVVRALPPLSAYVSLAAFWIGGGQPLSTLEAWRHADGFVGAIQLAAGVILITKAEAIASKIMTPAAESTRDDAN